jgi:hypothetical protein
MLGGLYLCDAEMTARIATRNGRPAYLNAPPRLRASQIERPLQPMPEQRGWLARLIGGKRNV